MWYCSHVLNMRAISFNSSLQFELFSRYSLKYITVATLTFRVTWRDVIGNVTTQYAALRAVLFPVGAPLTPTCYLDLFLTYCRVNYIWVATLTLRVTWSYRYILFPAGAGAKRVFTLFSLFTFRGWRPPRDVVWTLNRYNRSTDDVREVFIGVPTRGIYGIKIGEPLVGFWPPPMKGFFRLGCHMSAKFRQNK